jgi:hypothetical protein
MLGRDKKGCHAERRRRICQKPYGEGSNLFPGLWDASLPLSMTLLLFLPDISYSFNQLFIPLAQLFLKVWHYFHLNRLDYGTQLS